MGRFKADGIVVREIGPLTIVFNSPQTIYIQDAQSGCKLVFHRWFAPRGDYATNWKPFRKKLMEYKRISFNRCLALADKHGVKVISAARLPDLKGKKVIRRN